MHSQMVSLPLCQISWMQHLQCPIMSSNLPDFSRLQGWSCGLYEAPLRIWEDTETGWWFGTFSIFPSYGECHHPNWLSPSFFRWVAQPPTRKWFATLHGLTALAASNLSPETLDAFGAVATDSLFPEKFGLKRLPDLVNSKHTKNDGKSPCY